MISSDLRPLLADVSLEGVEPRRRAELGGPVGEVLRQVLDAGGDVGGQRPEGGDDRRERLGDVVAGVPHGFQLGHAAGLQHRPELLPRGVAQVPDGVLDEAADAGGHGADELVDPRLLREQPLQAGLHAGEDAGGGGLLEPLERRAEGAVHELRELPRGRADLGEFVVDAGERGRAGGAGGGHRRLHGALRLGDGERGLPLLRGLLADGVHDLPLRVGDLLRPVDAGLLHVGCGAADGAGGVGDGLVGGGDPLLRGGHLIGALDALGVRVGAFGGEPLALHRQLLLPEHLLLVGDAGPFAFLVAGLRVAEDVVQLALRLRHVEHRRPLREGVLLHRRGQVLQLLRGLAAGGDQVELGLALGALLAGEGFLRVLLPLQRRLDAVGGVAGGAGLVAAGVGDPLRGADGAVGGGRLRVGEGGLRGFDLLRRVDLRPGRLAGLHGDGVVPLLEQLHRVGHPGEAEGEHAEPGRGGGCEGADGADPGDGCGADGAEGGGDGLRGGRQGEEVRGGALGGAGVVDVDVGAHRLAVDAVELGLDPA
jgi:hypothetical protein